MDWNQEEEEEYQLSISRFESMLRTNKVLFFDSEEFENIILHYFDTGKTSMAKKALKLALEQHPKSTGLRLVQVEMLVYDNKLEIADKILNELLEIEPENEEIYIQKSNIFSKRGAHDKAIEVLHQALEFTNDYADIYSLLGMEYLFIDQIEKAKDCFIKCLEEDQNDYSSLYNVIYCFDFLDQHHQAIEFLNSFIDDNPYSEVAWHQLGKQYYTIKDYKNAVRAFDYATIIDDSFLGAVMEKGKSHEKLGELHQALECYKRTFELEDPTSFAYLRIGSCYEKLNDRERAIKNYRKAVTEDPLQERAWLAIINLYFKEQDYKKALAFVNKALDVDPENDQYWKSYTLVQYFLEDYEEFLKGYHNAMVYGNLDLEFYVNCADVCLAHNDTDEALIALLKAYEFFPDSSEVQYRLAGIYFSLKNDISGKFHLSNALSIDFDGHVILNEMFSEILTIDAVLDLIEKHRK